MAEWAAMNRERSSVETAERLEKIAAGNPQHYVAYVCRGVALGLQGKLKDGLVEKAIPLDPEEWDAYFWKGMLCAYYYKSRYQQAIEAIEKALQVGLTPLYWLKKDRLDFFEQYARPLLEKYGV